MPDKSPDTRISELVTKTAEKINALKTALGNIAPWLGLSSDPGQSLTTDAEGKLFFKERTPEEIAAAYEGLSDVERFTTSHKTTLEEFGADLSGKADIDPDTGKLRTDQVPNFSITNVVRATEDSLSEFITNVNNYEFDEGDAIIITYQNEALETVRQQYLYDGGDRALEVSYEPFTSKVIWDEIEGKPTDLETTSGAQAKADLAEANAKAYADSIASSPPVDATYADITALIADQNSQLEDYIYKVLDASDDGITGEAYYFYNGTIAGTMEDYTSLTAQEVADLTAQAIIDALGYTPSNDTDVVKSVSVNGGTAVVPDEDGKVDLTVEGGGGSGTVISSIIPITANYLLTTSSNNALIRAKDYASVIVPSGLGLKHRTVIKKATGKTVSLVAGENVILETPEGYLSEILAQNDAVEIVLEEIDGTTEYWGVYGALAEGALYGAKEFLNFANDTGVESPEAIFPAPHKSADWPELTTTKDYFFIYSSDHDMDGGSTRWAECDDPEGTGFVERGVILSGGQPESPCLIRIPSAKSGIPEEVFLYYHTNSSDPRNGGLFQKTWLVVTSGGAELHLCTWVDKGTPLGIVGDEIHTGYLCVNEAADGTYFGYHATQTEASPNARGVSVSTDGLNWTRLVTEMSLTNAIPSGWKMISRSAILPFYLNGTLYAFINYHLIGDLTIWKSGIFTLDSNYSPLAFVKEIGDFGLHDTTMYVDNGVAYLFPFFTYDPNPWWGALDDSFFIQKYYLPNALL